MSLDIYGYPKNTITNVDQYDARRILSEIAFLDGFFESCRQRGDGIATKDTARIRRLMDHYIMLGGTHQAIADVCSYSNSLLILKNLIENP